MKPSELNQSNYRYKYLIFLAVFYFMGWAVSYPVVYKLIYIHHVLESASTLFFPITYAISDVIAEVYGYRVARQVVWAGVICGLIFSAALEAVSYIPAANLWQHNKSYEVVFGHVFRVYVAVTTASIIGNFINIYIISKFKILVNGRLFWVRSLCSTGIGELVFTIIGGIMVWGGIQSGEKIALIMINAYLFKMLYAFIAVWPTSFVVKIIKRAEKTDVYDLNINYNPFKLTVTEEPCSE